jgi:hypothetical protein
MAPLPLLAGFAALIPFTVPGFAPPPGAETIPSSTLVLTTADADGGQAKTVNLHCEPAGGTHPHAQAACDELVRADGNAQDVEDLQDVACTFDYRPVHVTVTGTWRGVQRTFDHTYPNACAMRVDTGTVFQF